MSTRIRLQRHGRKRKPFFHIVVADSRSKRDGRFIEKLGTYNPNTNPATIVLDFDRCAEWISTGAQPSDTAKAILSYKGVLMYDHLMRGVAKGAFSEEEAKAKFAKWMEEKDAKVDSKKDDLTKAREAAEKDRLKREREVNEARVKANMPEPEVEEVVEAAPAPVEEAPVAEAPAAEEAPAKEEAKAEEPAKEEAPAKEEPKAEAPAKEEKAEAPAPEAAEEDKKEG